MSERTYLLLVGIFILAALYIDFDPLIYGLALWLLFEGLSGVYLSNLLQRVRHISLEPGLLVPLGKERFQLEASRVWRMNISLVLVVPFALVHEFGYDMLWFFPWFLGFAIIGAGVSGVCPMLYGLSWAGFR